MSFTAFIDVAIGLVVVYLGASLCVTVLNQGASHFFAWRQRVLKSSLDILFAGQGNTLDQAFSPFPQLEAIQRYLSHHGAQLDSWNTIRTLIGHTETALKAGHRSMATVREALEALPDAPIKTALLGIAATANDDVQGFIRDAGQWLEQKLTALGGDYQTTMKRWSLGIGFAIAVVLNIDSVHLTQRLYEDKALREQTASLAESVAKVQTFANAQQCLQDTSRKECQGISTLNTLMTQAGQTQQIPLGWPIYQTQPSLSDWLGLPAQARDQTPNCPDTPTEWLAIAAKLLGWLITAIAISFGAPFWFDLLNQLVSTRKLLSKV